MPRDQWQSARSTHEMRKAERDEIRDIERQMRKEREPPAIAEPWIDRELIEKIHRWVAILEGRQKSDLPRSLAADCIAAVADARLIHEMERVLLSSSSAARNAAKISLERMLHGGE